MSDPERLVYAAAFVAEFRDCQSRSAGGSWTEEAVTAAWHAVKLLRQSTASISHVHEMLVEFRDGDA